VVAAVVAWAAVPAVGAVVAVAPPQAAITTLSRLSKSIKRRNFMEI
jgi:hypothetical protein